MHTKRESACNTFPRLLVNQESRTLVHHRSQLINLYLLHKSMNKKSETIFSFTRKGNKMWKAGIVFLFAFISTSVFAQVTVSVKQQTIKQALRAIEKNTDYRFFYSNQLPDLDKTVSVDINNQSIDVAMNKLLKGTGLIYEQKENNQIYLAVKNAGGEEKMLRVSGTVKDQNGELVIGANVSLKGTTVGTITDTNGHFILDVPSNATLFISYIGYISQEVKSGNKTKLNIILQEDTQALEEVVVVGYTTMKRELLTGSVATMKMTEELKNTPSTSPANALAGKLSGVNVATGDGLPGNQSSVSIRAKSSWNDQNVLYVIDGMICDASNFNNLSANEIEDITVLKDAASAAVYGSRAAGGVVVVTTKTGTYGQGFKINYSFNTGFDKRGKGMELTDGVQTAELYMRINPTSDPAGWTWNQDEIDWMKTINGGWGYDLVDAVWQDPKITTHNIGINGGSEKIKFYAGGSFTKQEGFLENLSYKKNNFRVNLSAKLSDNLDIFGSIALNTNNSQHMTGAGIGNIYGVYQWLQAWQPDYPIYTDNGLPIDIGWVASVPAQVRGDGGYLRSNNLNPTMNMSATYKIPFVKGLSARASFSKSYTHNRAKNYQKRYKMYKTSKIDRHIWSTSDADIIETTTSSQIAKDYLEESSSWGDNWQYNLQLSYDRTFKEDHNLKTTLVFEKYEVNNGGLLAGIETFPVYNKDQWWATSSDRADSYVSRGTGYSDQSFGRQSWIGQLFYGYKDKYLLNASYRYDGSMNFAPESRWGFFPSASLGWILSKESFFNTKTIDLLKLRASVGLTGNDAIGGWQWQQAYKSGNSVFLGTGNKIASGITYGVLPNENLTWEKSLTYNVGVDMNFLQHFTLSAEYYYTNTYDILGKRSLDVPPTFSLELPAENYGEVHASGVELSLGYSNTFGDFNVSGALVASYANANFKKYDDDKVTYDHQKRVGRSMTAVYGYESAGIIRTQADLDKLKTEQPDYNFHGITPELGQLMYKDLSGPNGTPDGIVNNYDITILKKSNNPVLLGLTLGGEWKGLAINAVFNGNIGQDRFMHDMFDIQEWNRMWIDCYYDSWTPENPNASLPKKLHKWAGNKTYVQETDFWLKKSSYLRLKNLNVAYTIPQTLYKRFGLDKVQIYFVGTNMFVISKFNKNYYDPEMGYGMSFPIMKSYNFGINVTI